MSVTGKQMVRTLSNEHGQKDGQDVLVQHFDDEQTSDEIDSSSSSEID